MTTLGRADRELALRQLDSLVTRSQRATHVPFAKEFLQASSGHPPLSELVRGGRGGEVRLKLYLTITMVATRAPHDLSSPSPGWWAQTLGVTGKAPSRRVYTGLRWLAEHGFIRLTPRAGNYPTITLLDSALSRDPYERPMAKGSRYISLPLDIWRRGWILDLAATELALLMVLLDVQQGRDQGRYITGADRFAYGLSPDTWTKATKSLSKRGVLEVRRVPQGGEFDYRRMRNSYKINRERLALPPALDDESQ